MFRTLHAETADELWLKAAEWFVPNGVAKQQPSRAGVTREVLHAALSLSNPRQRWIASREPAINPAFAIAEVVWILNGRNDSAFLNFFNPRLPTFAGEGETYHGAYGYRLCSSLGFDQIQKAISALRNNQDSRQIVLQIWDGRTDFPHSDGSSQSQDIPCSILALLKIRNGMLEWTQVMRSNDLFLGLPHNLIQFTTLQEVIAGRIGVKLGEYNHLSDSLHLYEQDGHILNKTRKQVCPLNNDQLDVPLEDSERLFCELAKNVEKIVDPSIGSVALLGELRTSQFPQSYVNLLAILVADGCRRRKNLVEAEQAANVCTNPCLRFVWKRWAERVR
jgi:thymidylate synthase